MRIPVIRGQIGNWRYYTGVMTFEQISNRVSPSINNIYPTSCLNELLQRDLTDNYRSIKEYIEKDPERFFNALILALYDGDPQWLEVDFGEEFDIYNVGFLELPDDVIIFPVDGQHRVAGIIEALKDRPELNNEQIPVVFVAHEGSPEGIKRTRKLFSTLNRRAKPVGENSQIALDEDDINSIITRELIETCELFYSDRLINAEGKQIPAKNVTAFTSLVTLYQCNEIILQSRLQIKGKKYKDFLLYRPEDDVISANMEYIRDFWAAFSENISVIKEYLSQHDRPAEAYRNSNGGNILFRPMVLTEYVKAVLAIAKKSEQSFQIIFEHINAIKTDISAFPWRGVIWDGKKIVTRADKKLIEYLVRYMYDHEMLNADEKENMIERYARSISYDGEIETLKQQIESL